ncbi:DUF1549 domain-containing protein [Bremerella volcania]|nr:DUF1549 domain-containing protein [Bremerella volcania]
MRTISTVLLGIVIATWQLSACAETFEAIHPRTCRPGQSTNVVIHGKDLSDTLRLALSTPDITWKVEKIEPTQAVVSVHVPADHPLGPVHLWIAGKNGTAQVRTLLVDGMEAVADNGNNHSRESAQEIPALASVEGTCDPSLSDFYRLHVQAGQRVSFEVHTQILHSAMDPVCRVIDETGKTLIQADDSEIGPDIRFHYVFPQEGNYWIEVHDNRNAAGGAPYQLRVGDFPTVNQSFPLAVQTDHKAEVSFLGPDAGQVPGREIQIPSDAPAMVNLQAQTMEGKSATWVPLLTSKYPQVTESSSIPVSSPPIGISGRLNEPKEVDVYPIQGVKGQLVRFRSKTRSLNSPTLLQMQLLNASGGKITETKVSDTDEWSMDATFPDDGEYRLEVSDLLKRGGEEFSYWVELVPAGTFSVSIKGDAKTREQFAIELNNGACAIDLDVIRFGFDGEIDLALTKPDCGIRLVNSRIPAKANSSRVYLVASENWKLDQLESVKLVATASGNPANSCIVNSHSIHRAKEPFVLTPNSQLDGALILSASVNTDSPFAMEAAGPISFARPLRSHTAQMNLKRLQGEFKSGVEVLAETLPAGWGAQAKADKDAYKLTFTRNERATGEPDHLVLQAYGEFKGVGRLETINVPIQWMDPLKVQLSFNEPIVRGGSVHVRASLIREGGEHQPVTLTFANLPPGITGPESIVISADQSTTDFELKIGSDVSLDVPQKLTIQAASKFQGQDFSVDSTHEMPLVIESPKQLAIYPTAIELNDSMGRQQIVVIGSNETGKSRDWSRHARITSSRPEIAEVRNGVVYPLADGQAEINIEVGTAHQVIPVKVSQTSTRRPVQFESEVLVALSKQGCNSGACHGSPSGKGGFRLSLRAFDLKLDQLTLIHEDFGRRVNLIEPEKSLLLLKPLMSVAHGGGKQLHKGDEAYAILRDWIAGGAHSDPADTPRVTRLEVTPSGKQVRWVADGSQQLAVTAHFADGDSRDVTHLAAYESSNTTVATVNANGLVTPHARGEAVVLVRLLEYIESVPLMFVENQPGFQWAAPSPANYIDQLVNEKLRQLQYLPAETCTDAEFIRRVHLDLIGVLPTVEETSTFLSDASLDKRSKLIDALLDRDEYAKFWALKWGDLLKMTSKEVGDDGVYKYHRWVEDTLRTNMPYDEFATALLTGSGSTLANPPANFYRTAADMNQCVETISQVFLGARLQCAKCHNHPFERWTQDNYYGLGAFFNRVQHRNTDRPGEMFIYTSLSGEVTQPRTGEVMAPWLPQVGTIERASDSDQRIAFAEWLVNAENPYFARIEANRIWSHLFARGIVEPIDDFRDSNPPANGPLLDALEKDFVDSGFDRKHLLRAILNSRTYQASHATNEMNREDTTYFSHQEPRMLGAEQLLDAINHTLNLNQKLGSLPTGTLATQMPAPDVAKVDFLKVFGQPERSTVCACERSSDSNLGMAIELFNGSLIHEKLRDKNNRFRTSLTEGKSTEETIKELYLAALCRLPSEVELKAALDHCSKATDPVSGIEDVCWALFNTDEFLFQH